jgi:hypothetical protein
MKKLSQTDPTVAVCIAIALGTTLTYAIVGAVAGSAMYSDSGWGFLGWDNRHGLPFNHAFRPDRADFANDEPAFLSWWSPGQHVLPGLGEMAGLGLGQSMVAVVALFSLMGLAGWFVLYLSFGFAPASAAIAVAVIACMRHFSVPFGIYNGGEVLLFGGAPWFLVLLWRLREFRWTAVLPLVLATAIVTFLKLSGILLAACAIGAAAGSAGQWLSRESIRRGFVAGVTIATIGLAFYFLWAARGESPATNNAMQAGDWLVIPRFAVLAAGMIASGSLSFGDLASYIVLNPRAPLLGSLLVLYLAFLPVAVAIFVFVWWRLRRSHADYLRFTALLAISVTFVLTAIAARGGAVEADERHFRIVSLVLFGGIVHSVIGQHDRWVRAGFAAVVLAMAVYGVSSFAARASSSMGWPLGERGFRHFLADRPLLDFLRRIDVATPDRASTFIYVPSPEIALEIRNVRRFANHADFQTVRELEDGKYRGTVPRLYVIVQKRLVANGKAAIILRSFVDYPANAWQETPVGDFIVYFSDFGAR